MITNLDSSSERFLAALERTQLRLATAGQRISSGKRVTVASDAPDEISTLLQLKADLRHNTQVQSNLAMAKTNTDTADRTLDASIKLMDRARQLATQAGNATVDAAGRLAIAQEIQSLQDQMVANSRTTVQGRYLFSGDQEQDPQYVLDLSAPSGVVQLSNPQATGRIEDAAGGSFTASKTAQQIFDSRNPDDSVAPENVFAALNSLRLALVNDDPVALDGAMLSLRSASTHLTAIQGFYGAAQNRIGNAASFAAGLDVELRSQLSQKEDTDVVAEALEMTAANTQLQAAFQMRARMPSSSLFDYLA